MFDAGRVEPVEVQLVDPAVPPDFVLLAGQREGGERLDGMEPAPLQPWQAGKSRDGFGGEGGQDNGLSRKEAR